MATARQHLRYVRDSTARAKFAAVLRDKQIRDALEAGLSTRRVAEAAGLSPARIHQIRHGK